MNLETFFELMYADRPKGSHMLLWKPTKAGGSSLWTSKLPHAIAHVRRQKGDIYYQVGLAKRPYKRNQRCSLNEADNRPVIALPAVFADIDYRHPCHRKDNLPPDIEAAMSLVHGKGFDPTVTVNSGHGLQCYWIFKEPWETPTVQDRRNAQILLTRLKQRLQTDAARAGWHIDAVQDLVRVLRPPESLNCKEDTPVQVAVIHADDARRYNPDDFEEFLPPYDPALAPRIMGGGEISGKSIQELVSNLSFVPDAEPPADLFAAMINACGADFLGAWENAKKIKDRSPSGYDLSLATMVAQANWNDQQILNLMIAHRRKHGHDLKLHNRQYYVRTIVKARNDADEQVVKLEQEAERAEAFFEKKKYEKRFAESEGDPPEELKRKRLSKLFRIEIFGIERYLGENPTFKIHTERGSFKLPGLESHLRVRKAFINILRQIPDKSVKKQWDRVLQMMLDICEDVEVAPEATDAGEIIAMLREYLDGQGENTLEESTQNWSPFIKNRHWHIYPARFRDWVHKNAPGTFKNGQEMCTRLREAGCYRVDQNVYIEDRRTKKTTWKVPQSISKPEPENRAETRGQYSGHSVLNVE